jgi:Flp pilus assembly protein TadD/4-amino-4-deoxy-L-arabinose transferase-like glycosyltransferase
MRSGQSIARIQWGQVARKKRVPDPQRVRLGPWAALLAGAFLLKLIVVLQLKDHPLVQPEVGLDTSAYAVLAQRVLAGDLGLGPGLYFMSPLYIYFLAGGLAGTGSYTAVRVLQILLGTVSIGLIFQTAREWFGDRAAWIAAVLAAFTGLVTFYETLILQAALDAFLTAAALFALTRGLRKPSWGWLLTAGLVFGIATLNRPNMLLAAAGVAVVMVLVRRAIAPALVLIAGLAIGMAPVAVRNVIVAHQWSFVSSHGGLNLYIGNGPEATGFYHQIPGITPNIAGQATDAQRVAEKALGRKLTEGETSDYFVGLAMDWVRGHPGAALALFAKKFGYVFNAQHIALPYSYPFYAYDARTMLRFYVIGPWLLLPLGLVGLVAAAPAGSRKEYLVWASFVPAYAAAVAVFFVAERYRLPVLIPLTITAGAAIDLFWREVASKRWKALAVPAVALVAIFALANWRHGLHDGRWEEGLRMAQRLVILGRYDEADQWAERLEVQAPRPGMAHGGVGMQFLVSGQPERALVHFKAAKALDPNQPSVDYALGQGFLQTGRAAEAVAPLRRAFEAHVEPWGSGYDLADALKAAGDEAGAVDVIRRIPIGNQDNAELWLRIGRLAVSLHAPEAAEPFFRHGAELAPDQAGARLQYGVNLVVLGRFSDGLRELAEAARLDPRDADALAQLAYCEAKLGRMADARMHVAAALALVPDHPLAQQLAAALR